MEWTLSELCITKGRHMHLSQHSVRKKEDCRWCFYKKTDNVIHTTLEEVRETVLQRNLHMLP